LEAIMAVPESLTGQYMSGKRKIEVPKKRVPANPEKVLKLTGARGNNLKDVTLTLPVGLFALISKLPHLLRISPFSLSFFSIISS
ncbi:hypothetical protein JQN45_23760, partial [Escherichia coli]|nr:hypothetical protein [Escherichia coli]